MSQKHTLSHPAATLALIAACAGNAPGQNPTLFTSPLDITGARPVIVASAPDRDSGQVVDVALPIGSLPPQINQFTSQPLSQKFDSYWAVDRDRAGLTIRDKTCNGDKGIVPTLKAKVASRGSSFSAYDVSCNLAATGKLLLQQDGARQTLAYQLTGNEVNFTVTTPATCHTGHGTPFCPSDPHFTLKFAIQLIEVINAPDICHLAANPNVTAVTQAVSLEGNRNLAGALANVLDDLVLGHKFRAAEEAIQQTVTLVPSPLDGDFAVVRNNDGCTGRNIAAATALRSFHDLKVVFEPRQGLVFRLSHPPIPAPTVVAANPAAPPSNAPTFAHPEIATNKPNAQSGTAVQVTGRYFAPGNNFATQLPVWFNRSAAAFDAQCAGGGTELRWGPSNRPPQVTRLPGAGQKTCAPSYVTTNLAPQTAYQFSARDCDFVTCSPFSPTVQSATVAAGSNDGHISISLDGGAPLTTTMAGPDGTFSVAVTLPANAPAGVHRLIATGGADTAQASITVSGAATPASLIAIDPFPGQTGCPNHPVSVLYTNSSYMLFGAGFQPGAAAVYLDAPTGPNLAAVAVQPDGTFCHQMAQLAAAQVGNHRLVVVQNGAAALQVPFEVKPSRPLSVH